MSAWYDLALRHYQNGALDYAQKLTNYVLYFEAPDTKHYELAGAISQAKEEYGYAIGAYERAFLLDSTNAQVAFYMGQCYFFLHEWKKAIAWLEIAQLLGNEEPRVAKLLRIIKQSIT